MADEMKEIKDRQAAADAQREKAKSLKLEEAEESRKKELREKVAAVQAKMRQEYIAEHTVVSGDTLSGIAANYYNSAARDKWMAIYEANKETIGDNPGNIKVGQVLQIPKLDE